MSNGGVIHDVTSSNYRNGIDENDIVIAVMGPSGVGKRSFVSKAAGGVEDMIGYDSKSKPQTVQLVRCQHPDGRRNVVLVDTPGFDDPHIFDSQVLRIIAKWLEETYQNNIKLAGLLYLHRISDVTMAGAPLRNLAVFKDLCGDGNLNNIVIVTTMWDKVEDESVGSKREEELLSKSWKDMISQGSRTCRFQGTHESAWEIIDLLDSEGSSQKLASLQIQREMVDRGLQLHETAVAKTLFRFLRELLGDYKKVCAKMHNGTRGTTSPRKLSGSSGTASLDPWHPSSTAEITSSGCTPRGHQDILQATIGALKLIYQIADIAKFIPILRIIIGMVLHIAQKIEGMGGTHHAIGQVIVYSGWLLHEITQYAAGSQLSNVMKRTLDTFQRELYKLLSAVINISSRTRVARFFLNDADIRAITACTTSIKEIYDKFEVNLAMDDRRGLSRLEDQLTLLCSNPALRQCECGASLVREESGEN